MKKFFAIILTMCLLVGALSVAVSAVTVSTQDVIRVYGLKGDGVTKQFLNGFTNFAEGWEFAIDLAREPEQM